MALFGTGFGFTLSVSEVVEEVEGVENVEGRVENVEGRVENVEGREEVERESG